MSVTEIFQILGIEETKDERTIKNAYREKLAVTNPEDNPEGFKRLRTAYEEACNYAKSDEVEQEEEADDTPSGQWVLKAAQIYGRIDTRQDVKLWEELFEEDVFLSLEEEENCRMKLFRFMMEHFKLPTEVWKLLDEKLHITDSLVSLKESFPADFVSYMVNRCTQGEEIAFDKFEGTPDAEYDLFLQYSNNCWDALMENQLEQAEEFLKNADELDIYHPVMELNRAWLWEKKGKTDDAIEWLEKLLKQYPDDIMVCYHLAEMLWQNDRKARAAEVCETILGINPKHYMANMHLTEWYYEQGRFQEAKKCAEELLGLGVEDDFRTLLSQINHELEKDMERNYKETPTLELGLELGWCYLQDGKYTKGVSIALELEDKVTEEKKSEYRGLLAKLYAESADYKAAIHMAEIWEEALKERLSGEQTEEDRKKDEDRVKQSYAIRSFCYRRMGYKDKEQFQKAIECIEKVEKKDEPDINMMLEKAFVYLEMEEYDKCLELTHILVEDYRVYAAYATEQEVYRKMWDAEGVLQSGYNCIHFYPDFMRPYERIAKVYSDLKYTEDLEKLLEDAKEQNFESVYLEACRYRMTHEIPDNEVLDKKLEEFRKEYLEKVEEGLLSYYEKGLPLITEYLYWCPGAYMLVERGLFHKAAGEYEKAIEDFSKALEDEPGNPYALNAMVYCYRLLGDYEQALICNRKAIFYFEEEYARSYSDMGDIYSLLGDHKMALKAYEEVLRVGNEGIRESGYYMRRYANALARNGRLAEAEEVIDRAFGNHFERYSELSELYYNVGEEEKARQILQQWKKALGNSQKVVKKSDYADLHTNEAWNEMVFGDGRKALDFFEKAIQSKGAQEDKTGAYFDMVYACALCGDDERGMLYGAKLRDVLKKAAGESKEQFHEMEKLYLARTFMAKYYFASVEELEDLLERNEQAKVCYFCSNCICKEMEGLRILHLLRMGKKQEAFERVEMLLEKQPLDDFVRCIRNICKDDVKVVPYSVNGYPNRKHGAEEESEKVQEAPEKILKVTKPEPGTRREEILAAREAAEKEAKASEGSGLGARLKSFLAGIFKS